VPSCQHVTLNLQGQPLDLGSLDHGVRLAVRLSAYCRELHTSEPVPRQPRRVASGSPSHCSTTRLAKAPRLLPTRSSPIHVRRSRRGRRCRRRPRSAPPVACRTRTCCATAASTSRPRGRRVISPATKRSSIDSATQRRYLRGFKSPGMVSILVASIAASGLACLGHVFFATESEARCQG
jgi:hypothetical protein